MPLCVGRNEALVGQKNEHILKHELWDLAGLHPKIMPHLFTSLDHSVATIARQIFFHLEKPGSWFRAIVSHIDILFVL